MLVLSHAFVECNVRSANAQHYQRGRLLLTSHFQPQLILRQCRRSLEKDPYE